MTTRVKRTRYIYAVDSHNTAEQSKKIYIVSTKVELTD